MQHPIEKRCPGCARNLPGGPECGEVGVAYRVRVNELYAINTHATRCARPRGVETETGEAAPPVPVAAEVEGISVAQAIGFRANH